MDIWVGTAPPETARRGELLLGQVEPRWHGYTSLGTFVAGCAFTVALAGLNAALLMRGEYRGSLVLEGVPPGPVALAVVTVQALVLSVARARYAGWVVAFVGASALVYAPDFPTGYLPHAVAFFGAGAYGSPRLQRAAAGLIAAFGVLAGLSAFAGSVRPGDARWAIVIVAVLASALLAGSRNKEIRLSAKTAMALAERERAEELERTVAQERARIARELHDVLAHTVSVIVLQARGASSVLPSDPERARAALGTIESLARQSMDEIRRLVGAVRTSADAAPLDPQPGLDGLRELADQTIAAGVPVSLDVDDVTGPLPPGLELCAYRIVQESLTNVLKHAGGASAVVRVRRSPRELVLEITDDGRGAASEGAVRMGHGLIGMRERVALFDGELRAGPRPEGGWRVEARLPVDGSEAPRWPSAS